MEKVREKNPEVHLFLCFSYLPFPHSYSFIFPILHEKAAWSRVKDHISRLSPRLTAQDAVRLVQADPLSNAMLGLDLDY